MNHLTAIGILDLSDEILITIFNKLNSIDVLCSLIGVNKKLDELARDSTFSRSLDFVTLLSNKESDSRVNSVVDRFSVDVLPQIRHNIECLTLEPSLIECVLYTGEYPKLRKLTLVKLKLEVASCILTNESLLVTKFKHNISHLVLKINDYITTEDMWNLITNIYTCIFVIFPNLTHLEFDPGDNCGLSPAPFCKLSATSCYSSSIIYLCVRVCCLDDCLYLLDGRFSQLRTFIVEVDHMFYCSMTCNKKEPPLNLERFSLFSSRVEVYDDHIVPLLRRMTQLKDLTLSLVVQNRSSFIDGIHLDDDVLSNMPQLRTFIFDIVTEDVMINEECLPSSDDIRRTFIQRGHYVDCYIDYCPNEGSRCHVYSIPYTMDCLRIITNNFPGGLFMNVRRLMIYDTKRPFEHDFFVRISQSFPSLQILSLQNTIKPENKRSYQLDEHEKTSSTIKYHHLTNLYFGLVHIDYIEQFLIDSKTYLPCLQNLYIEYENLVNVTENFTRNETRATCSKLKDIIFEEGTITLTTLNLQENPIGDEGAQYLADVLQTNTTLTKLNLRTSHIGNRGAQYLITASDWCIIKE